MSCPNGNFKFDPPECSDGVNQTCPIRFYSDGTVKQKRNGKWISFGKITERIRGDDFDTLMISCDDGSTAETEIPKSVFEILIP